MKLSERVPRKNIIKNKFMLYSVVFGASPVEDPLVAVSKAAKYA